MLQQRRRFSFIRMLYSGVSNVTGERYSLSTEKVSYTSRKLKCYLDGLKQIKYNVKKPHSKKQLIRIKN